MARKMGIDYGTVRIGIAISDPLGIAARGIETISWNGQDMEWAINRISELCKENQVDTVVVGLPRRTDGKTSASEENARILATRIDAAVNQHSISQLNTQLNMQSNMQSNAQSTTCQRVACHSPVPVTHSPVPVTHNPVTEKVTNYDITNENPVKVILKDERYTSVLANRIMRDAGIKNKKKKAVVDQIAAEIILQDFLDHNRE